MDLVAFLELRVVAEDDHADLGLVEVQREAGDAVPEVEHLVQHHVGEPFDPRDAVPDLADHADAPPGEVGFGARDLRFDVPYEIGHVWFTSRSEGPGRSQARRDGGQPGPHAAVVHVAANRETHPADERGVV